MQVRRHCTSVVAVGLIGKSWTSGSRVKRDNGFPLASCMLVRLEDARIIGAGHETLHQRCVLGLMGRLGLAG